MTKNELRAAYKAVHARYVQGDFLTNEYALHLDEMLAEYFGMPLLDNEDIKEG